MAKSHCDWYAGRRRSARWYPDAVQTGPGQLADRRHPRDSNRQLQHSLVPEYGSDKPRIVFQRIWISGEANTVQMRILNPGKSPLIGNLFLQAGHLKTLSPLPVEIPAQSDRVVKMPLELPPDAPDGLSLRQCNLARDRFRRLELAFRVQGPYPVHLQPQSSREFSFAGRPGFPLVHPTLASLKLPGEAVFYLKLKNWRARAQSITVGIEPSGEGLRIGSGTPQVNLPAYSDRTIEIRALPTRGSGVYQFSIRLGSGSFELKEAVILTSGINRARLWPMSSTTTAMASMTLSSKIRKFAVSSAPTPGGRSFALVLKDSNHNAFNSVGGMRDTFSKRVEPQELQGLNQYTRMNWMGLTNRPYRFQIVSSGSSEARVSLSNMKRPISIRRGSN